MALVGTWLQLKFAAVDAYMTTKHIVLCETDINMAGGNVVF